MERIVSGFEAILRPIAKELIKGGIVIGDAVCEFTAETSEQFKDLLAEAKAEREQPQRQEQEADKTGSKESANVRRTRTGGKQKKK